MITLDGSQGEGGGQILRSALALSLVTGQPFRITHIRAGRPKPGLMRQHLACVEASARLSGARSEGAHLGSTELVFQPGRVAPGAYEFKIGSAGSTLLLLQTILPPLLRAGGPSEVALEGGTHNPFAPPFPFIEHAFVPLLRRMGFDVSATLERAGFYPNGGGRLCVKINPTKTLQPFALLRSESAATTTTTDGAPPLFADVFLAGLPRDIAERELQTVQQRLRIPPAHCRIIDCRQAVGPGNTVHVRREFSGYAEVFTGFGTPRGSAERIAGDVAREALEFHNADVPVGPYLADQLLLPLAIAAGGVFGTVEPTGHTRTNADIIHTFLGPRILLQPVDPVRWKIEVHTSSAS